MTFTHLHGHSTFSFLEAIGKPAAILNKAKDLGMNAIAITDYNGMYGAIKLYQWAKDTGVKPILWVELGFVVDCTSYGMDTHIGNIVILAKNKEWYQNLMELTSFANQEGSKGKPKIDIPTLKKFWSGVICLFWGTTSWLGKMIGLDEKETKIREIIHLIQEAVGSDNVFLEIVAQSYTDTPDIQKINDRVLRISEQEDIPCIVNNVYNYPNKGDREAREVALAIKDGVKIYDENRRKPRGQFYIMTEEEIRNILVQNGIDEKNIDTMIANNERIAESITTEIDLNQALFPNYETPEAIKTLYEQYKDSLDQDE